MEMFGTIFCHNSLSNTQYLHRQEVHVTHMHIGKQTCVSLSLSLSNMLKHTCTESCTDHARIYMDVQGVGLEGALLVDKTSEDGRKISIHGV